MPKKTELLAPDIALRPIHANEGVRAAYRKRLQELAQRMARDILRRLKRHYRPAANRFGMDDDPIVTLRTVMRHWGRLWQRRFDEAAKDIAEMFATRSQAHLEAAMRKRLREAGFTVKFRPTARMTSAYRAVVAENVNLIRSIPQQFLKDVESTVWSSVMRGGAMYELSNEIRAKYGVTYRRAALISRDQTNKAKSVIEEARRAEIGIETAIWHHSHAGKQPRPTHLAMHGKIYKISEGMWDSAEQKYIWPGQLINCRCTSRAVIHNRLAKRE